MVPVFLGGLLFPAKVSAVLSDGHISGSFAGSPFEKEVQPQNTVWQLLSVRLRAAFARGYTHIHTVSTPLPPPRVMNSVPDDVRRVDHVELGGRVLARERQDGKLTARVIREELRDVQDLNHLSRKVNF